MVIVFMSNMEPWLYHAKVIYLKDVVEKNLNFVDAHGRVVRWINAFLVILDEGNQSKIGLRDPHFFKYCYTNE